MWFVDFPTLALLILAGLNVGVLAVWGYNPAQAIFGTYVHIVYALVGASAVWQLLRQRFF
jgi:uncharacterized membrane protein YuzA (DUF378 family)